MMNVFAQKSTANKRRNFFDRNFQCRGSVGDDDDDDDDEEEEEEEEEEGEDEDEDEDEDDDDDGDDDEDDDDDDDDHDECFQQNEKVHSPKKLNVMLASHCWCYCRLMIYWCMFVPHRGEFLGCDSPFLMGFSTLFVEKTEPPSPTIKIHPLQPSKKYHETWKIKKKIRDSHKLKSFFFKPGGGVVVPNICSFHPFGPWKRPTAWQVASGRERIAQEALAAKTAEEKLQQARLGKGLGKALGLGWGWGRVFQVIAILLVDNFEFWEANKVIHPKQM